MPGTLQIVFSGGGWGAVMGGEWWWLRVTLDFSFGHAEQYAIIFLVVVLKVMVKMTNY